MLEAGATIASSVLLTALAIVVSPCNAEGQTVRTPLEPRYNVRIALSNEACVRCMYGLFGLKSSQMGALQGRVAFQVETRSERVKKRVVSIVSDTMLWRVKKVAAAQKHQDSAVIALTESDTPLRAFKLPDEAHLITEFIDSVDAATTIIEVDTTQWTAQNGLRTRITFDESSQVSCHLDGGGVSVALKDRALVILSDTARVFPQYTHQLPDTLKTLMMIPTSTVVVNPSKVLYSFLTAENPLDTVIAGEEAKVFRDYRHWFSDVSTTPQITNTIRQVLPSERNFGFWRLTDSTYTDVPDEQIGDEIPKTFRFRHIAVDIPAEYFPVSPALCSAYGDYVFCCKVRDGWIRISRTGDLIRLPTLSQYAASAEITRSIAFSDGVLLTFDVSDESLRSVYLSLLGTRVSPVFRHAPDVIIAPVWRSGKTCLEAYRRKDNLLQRRIVWTPR